MSIYSTITRNQPSSDNLVRQGLPYKGSDIEEYFSDPETDPENGCETRPASNPPSPTST